MAGYTRKVFENKSPGQNNSGKKSPPENKNSPQKVSSRKIIPIGNPLCKIRLHTGIFTLAKKFPRKLFS